jgi:lipoprotein-anchoring transpeptidase ErfK/SrfK
MRRRLALIAIVPAMLLVGAIAALAYDGGRQDVIMSGTTVGGVDVGGKRVDAARQLLERHLARLAMLPITLVHGPRRIVITPRQLKARLDLAGLASRALRDSRRGDPFTRAVREMSGASSGIHLAARVAFSAGALDDVVRRVGRAIGHPARAADIDFTSRGLRTTPARDGIAVIAQQLRAAIVRALGLPARQRIVQVPVRVTRRPRRTLADLRRRYNVVIAISRPRKQLRLYEHLHLVRTYVIAVGAIGHKTKAGRYEILTKIKNPAWHAPNEPWAGRFAGKVIPAGSPNNPIKARWLGFHDGEGIHGTDDISSLGESASHGCIRMSVHDVEDLFRRVPLRAPVFVV